MSKYMLTTMASLVMTTGQLDKLQKTGKHNGLNQVNPFSTRNFDEKLLEALRVVFWSLSGYSEPKRPKRCLKVDYFLAFCSKCNIF